MRKRLLAMLLALMLVVGLLPVGVLADNGPTVVGGDPIEGVDLIYYRIYAHQALKMLHTALPEEEITEDTSIKGIELHLKNALVDDRNCDFMPAGANNLYYWYPTAGITGANGVGYASNIKSLTIEYDNGNGEKSVEIQADALQCRVIGDRTYSIESNYNDEYVVAFYNTKGSGAQSVYDELYAIRFVDANTELGHNRMPEDPVYDEDYASAFVFTNWDKSATGGDPYLPYDLVNIDTVVYARKTTSSGAGGTEYHVMNSNNVLLERFIELYNDKNDTTYTVSSIEIDSVKIQVNGTNGSTNSNYWNNKWKNASNPYYRVVNSGIAGDHPTISNTHVPHDEAQSITIFATVDNDADASVTIDVGNYKGDVSLSQVQDNIVEIIVNETGEEPDPDPDPEVPEVPEVLVLLKNAIQVDCVGKANHTSVNFFTPLGGYDVVGDGVTDNGDGTYSYVISISALAYLKNCNTHNYKDVPHKLADGQKENVQITFTWKDGVWTCPYSKENKLVIKVTCDSDEPETTDYLAGFFVLMPEKMDDSFVPGGVYPTDSYYPNADGDSVTTASNPEGMVDDTTGYIGYLTEAGYEYFKEKAGEDYPGEPGSVRVTIPTEKADEYLIIPEEEELGTVWDEYLINDQYELVCYQINNSTLGAKWPSITSKAGSNYETYDGQTFHVDCYIQGVAIAVTYDANYDGGAIYKHDKVNGEVIRTGDSYIVLGNTAVGFSREGYTFKGWSTSKDGDVIYTAGETINPIMTDTILYAVWEEDESQTEDPTSPGEADLGKLSVILDCTNETAEHDNKTFHMNTGNCTVEIESVDGIYICTVTPNYKLILERYNEQVPGGHTYADDAERTLLLSWNPVTKAWDVAGAPSITRQVKCDTPEQPNVYEIYVTVHNGTATFRDSEVTSYILAAENEDITITFTPDEGYTLDYATIDGKMLPIPPDGVYTLKQVDSNHTIKVVYAEDKLGGGEDGNKPDGTPDYRQVFVKYVAADENGFVTPSFDTFNLEVDEIGKVMTNVALSLSGEATPNADATFAYWTIDGPGYDGGAYSYEADLSGEDFTGYVAGQTYTFTAHFNGPVVKPELKPYNINVEVVNGTAEFKETNIGANSVIKVYPIEDDNKNVTITFVPEDGFVFDAAYVGNEPVDLKDNSYTFGEVTADVTIKVLFKQDSVPITPVTPMPTPGEISDLIKDSITVDCVNGEVAHADKVYGLLDGSLVNVEKTDDTSIKVTLDATVYQARYNTDTETKHSLASGQSATVTFTLKYVDSKWTLPADAGELPATIKVVCATPAAPKAPTEDELKALFDGKVFVDCVEKSWHPTYAYGLLADGYTVAGPVKGADGEYTCTVTLLASAYLAEYNTRTGTKHYLAEYETNASVELKWTGSAWTVINGELPVTFDVVCDTWYPPIIPPVTPSEPDYKPEGLNTKDHFAYIIGYEDGTVRPNGSITRAEVATIFFRLLTDETREQYWSSTNSYTDVKAGDWFNNAVSTLSRMGILGGYADGTFRPNASITRAEFAKIAVSFFKYKDIAAENIFADVAPGSWYESFIAAAAEIGLIEGYEDGTFRPNSSITRAEACTIINRTLNRAPEKDHLLPVSEMNVWPDNPYTAWFYADIQEATNSHEYKRLGDIEQWLEKLPERDWAELEK